MKFLIGFVIIIVLSIPLSIFGGLVLSDLWKWFVVPLGVVPIGIAHAIGLMQVVGMFKAGLATAKVGDGDAPVAEAIAGLFGFLVAYLIIWGTGAVVHSFM